MEADVTLDVRNKVCPMPVLLTRRKLEEMESGKVLHIIGNIPASKENIQRFAQGHGHEILEVTEERTQYEIFIKKHEGERK